MLPLISFDGFVRFDEKFRPICPELARAKGEIARRDFIAEGFAHLRDAEGNLLTRGFEDVFELRENGLGGFRAEVGDVFLAFFERFKPSFSPSLPMSGLNL